MFRLVSEGQKGFGDDRRGEVFSASGLREGIIELLEALRFCLCLPSS